MQKKCLLEKFKVVFLFTRLMGIDPLIGMATGSIPMNGGQGTVGGFSSVHESMGLQDAGTLLSWLLAQTGITFPTYSIITLFLNII